MILSTQYFRPPFPLQPRWEDDFELIADTGFTHIYVSACWSWIEAQPGEYGFDDYDRLMQLARQHGLKVIVNLWAETQPVWMPRLYPQAAMIDHMGRPVVSSQLAYMQFGLMPGGCMDHPDVRTKAAAFLSSFARRYASDPQLWGWDCWNEMRWMSQSDGYVCFCQHSLDRYRAWLQKSYGSLDALNRAWRRRYVDWRDVMPPKAPARTYTDAMPWQTFISERTAEDLRWRYDCVRAEDRHRPIIAHAAFPSVFNTGEFFENEPALARGNDWRLAEQVDGYGCSHFPNWFHPSPADFGARIESVRSATGDKPYWLAELQGGAAGHGMQAMQPVEAEQQQRWIWTGVARGAKAVNFWCWRDEVFARESGGFGIVGDDGRRDERLAALKATAALFREHRALLDGYRPWLARVAVVFEPQCYYLDWAAHSNSGLAPLKEPPYRSGHSVQGYLRALERVQLPYDVIEPQFQASLDAYRLIVLPCAMVVDASFAQRLADWVRRGGTLIVEASLDAFDRTGLFNYPGERVLPDALGLKYSARRQLAAGAQVSASVGGETYELRATRWLEDISTAASPTARSAQNVAVGAGRVIALGTFTGLAYHEERYADFERFIAAAAAQAGALPQVQCDLSDGEILQWRMGQSHGGSLLFVVNHGAAASAQFIVRDSRAVSSMRASDLIRGASVGLRRDDGLRLRLDVAAGGCHLIRLEPA